MVRKYEKDSVSTKGVKLQEDTRELQEQIQELRMVLKGLIHSYNFVLGYNISSVPVTESGNPKFGSFGDWMDKYSESGGLKQ